MSKVVVSSGRVIYGYGMIIAIIPEQYHSTHLLTVSNLETTETNSLATLPPNWTTT